MSKPKWVVVKPKTADEDVFIGAALGSTGGALAGAAVAPATMGVSLPAGAAIGFIDGAFVGGATFGKIDEWLNPPKPVKKMPKRYAEGI